MSDRRKTKQQLLDELTALRQQLAELEQAQQTREQVEQALRSAEERFRVLLAAVPDLIIRIRRDGTFLDFSPSTQFTTYVPPDRFLGGKMQDLMPPEMVAKTLGAIEHALRTGSRATVEYHLAEPHGVRYYEARIVPSGRDDAVAIVRDVSERRLAEEALRESEQRYRNLFENSQGLICTHDLEGRLLAANPAAARLLGYERDEIAGLDLRAILAPDVRHLLDPYLARIRHQRTDAGLMRILTKTGEERVWTYRNVLREEAGETPYVIGHALDVTELRRAEKAAGLWHARYRGVFERAPLGICRMNPEGGLVALNPPLVALLGYRSEEEVVGDDGGGVVWADRSDCERLVRGCRTPDGVDRLETRWRRKDGGEVVVRLSGWPVVRENGEVECFEVIVQPAHGSGG